MSKISTKNILKKIFRSDNKKKVKKNASKPKTSSINVQKKKSSKIKKVEIKKTKLKKSKKLDSKKSSKIKKQKKIKEVKLENKTDNLRISKSNEIKPEIKKVKKQESEKREYKIKDYIVYPKHGVGQITEFKKINIGGIDVETYVINLKKIKLMEWFLLINNFI